MVEQQINLNSGRQTLKDFSIDCPGVPMRVCVCVSTLLFGLEFSLLNKKKAEIAEQLLPGGETKESKKGGRRNY